MGLKDMLRGISHKQKAVLLTMSILGCLANPVYAADTNQTDVVKTRDVIVSATRTEQEVKETPASVEVITHEDIETMGAETLAQALKLAVGIDVLENGMVGNTVSIRGMKTNQTLILVNGRRIRTEDTSETANNYELQRINMDNVEKIEIVRGPASSLYGSEALGGVINIIMKKPTEAKTTVSLSSTSHQNDTSIYADFGKQGKWAWAMSGRATDVKERTTGGTTNQFGDKYYFNLEGTMDIDKNKKLDVYYDVLKEQLDQDSTYSASVFSSAKPSTTSYDHTRTSTGITYSGKDSIGDYEFRTYYTNFEKKQRQRYQSNNKLISFDDMEFNSWITDGKRTIQAADNHLITVGGEYRKEDYEGTRIGTGSDQKTVTLEGISNKSSKSSMDYSALYLQDEWIMSDKWLVIPSVRYDHNNQFGDEVTSKIGTTYKLNENSRVKANIGTAYKAPTASELYMNWRHAPTGFLTVNILGNPDLQPETSKNYEISFEAEKDNNFGKLTYFKNDVSNLINSKTLSSVGNPMRGMVITSQWVNIDKAEISGVEFEAGRHLSDKFTLKTTYTNLDAVDDTSGGRLEGRAKNRISLQLQYDDVKATGVSAVVWNEWVRDYLQDTTNYSYSTLNFSVNKKFNDKYSMYFGIDNLLDKKVENLAIDGLIWRTGVTLSI